MDHSEHVLRLRGRLTEAVRAGHWKEDSNLFQATLISILNEAERERIRHSNAAQKAREQASFEDGHAAAFSLVMSMVYNVLNGFITQSEKAALEEQERLNEKSGDGSVKE
jgi:hypothetical protein